MRDVFKKEQAMLSIDDIDCFRFSSLEMELHVKANLMNTLNTIYEYDYV